MNLRNILNTIDELNCFYENREEEDKIISCVINDNIYLLSKTEAIDYINLLIEKEKINLKNLNQLIIKLKLASDNGYEISLYNDLMNLIKRYYIDLYYNIDNIKKNPNYNNLLNRNNFIIEQCKSFDSFKHEQNNFDNMISILKIIKRVKAHYGYDIKLKKINFNTKNDNSEIYKKEILNESSKDFGIIRFII